LERIFEIDPDIVIKEMRKMRIETIETESRYKAKKAATWATVVTKVCGGFMAFESIEDYRVWKNQK